MAILNIRLVGDPVLRKKAEPVKRVTKKIVKLLRDMEETMYDASGVGLAAPQVGHSLRVIVVDVGDGPVRLINPVIEESSGLEVDREGCLSIPGVVGYVERSGHVKVSGINEKGKAVRLEAEGYFARALQHEIDHLDGILMTDKATSVTVLNEDNESKDNESMGDRSHDGRVDDGGESKNVGEPNDRLKSPDIAASEGSQYDVGEAIRNQDDE